MTFKNLNIDRNKLDETIQEVIKTAASNPWRFAYQSQGRSPGPWLGPEAGQVLQELSAQGHKNVLMAPIGFISDHLETLYDVDILLKEQAESLGMQFERVASLNSSPGLVETLADVVCQYQSKV